MDQPGINRKTYLIDSFKDELGRIFLVSFGVFLFILFFQPFPLGMLEYNDRILYVTGFWLINFILEWIIFILFPFLIPGWFKMSQWDSGPPILTSFLLLVVTMVSFTFYIRFVGKAPISLYIMFKIFLVCVLPLLIHSLLYKIKSMESVVSILQTENKFLTGKLHDLTKSAEDDEFNILSDNKSDKLSLRYKDIVLVKSADNYIEIYHLSNNILEKKLIRNTLKSIEAQLAHHKGFIRCHRTCIVNISFIESLSRDFSGYSLKIRYFEEKMAVSRPFLPLVKEAISAMA